MHVYFIYFDRKNFPPNSKILSDLDILSDRYYKMLTGDTFLIYDSLNEDFLSEGRVVESQLGEF